jgi:hypothetical protein
MFFFPTVTLEQTLTSGNFTSYKRRGTAFLTTIVTGSSYVEELPNNGGVKCSFPIRCLASHVSALWRVCRIENMKVLERTRNLDRECLDLREGKQQGFWGCWGSDNALDVTQCIDSFFTDVFDDHVASILNFLSRARSISSATSVDTYQST